MQLSSVTITALLTTAVFLVSVEGTSIQPAIFCNPSGTLHHFIHKCECKPHYFGPRCNKFIRGPAVLATSKPNDEEKEDNLDVYPKTFDLSKLRNSHENPEEISIDEADTVKFQLLLLFIGFMLCLCAINFYYRIQRHTFRRYVASRLRGLQHEELLNYSSEMRIKCDFPPTYDEYLQSNVMISSNPIHIPTQESINEQNMIQRNESELHATNPILDNSQSSNEEDTEKDSPPILYKGSQRFIHV
ncbi:hypothetical protein WR25_25210 [Diploscapter pachys]|uniref:EGF-like domain-containing protein n=1 Tax=Diploscapter pachys TaxID=2018661 RepID=A0A2A2LFM1_9BILA|nr:hypothetical protein WR25_25210 [Diploscapter pachys]